MDFSKNPLSKFIYNSINALQVRFLFCLNLHSKTNCKLGNMKNEPNKTKPSIKIGYSVSGCSYLFIYRLRILVFMFSDKSPPLLFPKKAITS